MEAAYIPAFILQEAQEMKKNILRNNKHLIPACIGIAAILLLGFSACDFQPAEGLARGRPVGGGLALGKAPVDEFLESGGGGGGTTLDTIQSGDKKNYPMLSKADIKKLLDDTDNSKLKSPIMARMPNWNPNGGIWDPGEVKKEALELALARLNAIRRICGLFPVVMTDEGNKNAQYGAALMSLTKHFAHGGQPQPAGVDQDSYQKGLNATNGGNLYKLPPEKLVAAVDGYCLDPGNPGIGHRITLLSPGQLQVGIGTVPAPSDSFASNVMQVYSLPALPEGTSKKPADFDYDFVSYPAAGYFPLEGSLFGSPAFWHVQFNGSKYTVSAGKIIVTKVDSGEQWVEEHSGGGMVIFNKSNKWRPELGKYTYEVTGVRNKTTGIPERFVFTTEFFKR